MKFDLVRQLRVVLYSHDTMGLGHFRRNRLIANALAQSELRPALLLIAGSSRLAHYQLPPHADSVLLPGLHKDRSGAYTSRSLPLLISELTSLRSRIIRTTLESFRPDVLIVDRVARGALGELDASLEMVRASFKTRCVLGLRDVLDSPAAVQHEWARDGTDETIRSRYDAVWVYGDPGVYDTAREYDFSDLVRSRLRYTGYLDPRSVPIDRAEKALFGGNSAQGPVALCLVGGGQDGFALAESFCQSKYPAGAHGVVVAGPFMPASERRRLEALAGSRHDLRVVDFVDSVSPMLVQAECVISMGGYNTMCELLAHDRRTLVVPRIRPRSEQMIRARRLEDLGLVDLLHPDDVSPEQLSLWMSSGPSLTSPSRVDMEGVRRIPALVGELMARPQERLMTGMAHAG